jgi:hypothetical protein
VERRARNTGENFACTRETVAARRARTEGYGRDRAVAPPARWIRPGGTASRFGRCRPPSELWTDPRSASFCVFSEALANIFARIRRLIREPATCPPESR